MRTDGLAPNLCVGILLSSLTATLMAQPSAAEGTRSMTVLGSIDGTADGTERAWLTIAGEVEGRAMSSAAWRPYSMANVMGSALDGMSDAQRAQMQKQMEMMSEMMGDGADNPLAQMFGDDGEEQVQLRIMGVDPEAERILRQGGLTIELPPFSPENTDSLLTGPNEVEISYHKNFGESTGFYASSHDVGTAATVAFDQLDIVAGGGFAAGVFEGTLCPIRALMSGDPDPDVCITVAGRFETDLGEEAADNSGSQAGN
ncbi:hypothetical protein SAMN04490248_11415 [Salinihabitans flavidus]|uniref:DUF4412 domain-containing protein n=1 Tax=Salinihabitans flavidus TaxID=569882 RepID=A0A1H8T2K5_9RHOB|nr:hypothetical protein [Salinihabitans flavidus]SEO85172.1 hypothetical protein SAMN04490248_11415 [Salinihabitans flavidus]